MSRAETILRQLSTFATSEEIALLAILYSDDTTRRALQDGDMHTLAKVYQVTLYCYEDSLKEQYGVIFRNQPGRFEVVQGNRPVMAVEDDYLGSCGCAVTLLLKERDDSRLPVSYVTAVSGRYRADTDHILAQVDALGLNSVLPQLGKKFPILLAQISELSALLADHDSTADRRALVNSLATVFTLLRSARKDVMVEYKDRTARVVTLAELLSTRCSPADDYLTVVPCPAESSDSESEEDVAPGKFSKYERKMCRAVLKSAGYVKHEDGEGEYYVRPERSVFSFIGSKYVEIPPLPEWTTPSAPSTPQRGIEPAQPTAVVVRPPTTSYAQAVRLVMDYKSVDMNKYKDVKALLVAGGLNEGARQLYADLSKRKKEELLRGIVGRIPFDEAVEVVAGKLGLKPGADLAELVASKLVLAKSAVVLEQVGDVLYVEK